MVKSSVIVRAAFWCAAIFFGFLQAWSDRMSISNDTISFLDMGDFILHGNWGMVINGYWNPFFAALLGIILAILKPSPYWEFAVIHGVMFFLFLFAMGCFDLFLREMMGLYEERREADQLRVPEWIWLTLGYSIFLWSSLALITISETNPDMLVAAFFYLAAALLVRLRRGPLKWPSAGLLGLVLGLGYLTKAIMFPVGIFCLAMAALMALRSRRLWPGVGAAIAVFLLVTLPFIIALSIDKGKPTFGENGTVNYFVDIGHAPLTHWQGDEARYGRLLHPAHQVIDRPATFEFAGHNGVTYPLWYDPSYWYQGAKPDYRIGEMAKVVNQNIRREIAVLITSFNGAIVVSLFILFCVSGRGRKLASDVGAFWFLLVPVVATFGLYSLLHIDNRYVAPFFTVGLLALYFSLRLRAAAEAQRLFAATAVILVVMLISPIGPGNIPKNTPALRAFLTEPFAAEHNPYAEVVAKLRDMGLRPGDAVASVDYSNCAIITPELGCEAVVLWARLGRFRVVSEVYYSPVKPETKNDNYWDASSAQQEQVLAAFTKSGARIVASWQVPRGPGAAGWQRLGTTHWYVRSLEAPQPNTAQQG